MPLIPKLGSLQGNDFKFFNNGEMGLNSDNYIDANSKSKTSVYKRKKHKDCRTIYKKKIFSLISKDINKADVQAVKCQVEKAGNDKKYKSSKYESLKNKVRNLNSNTLLYCIYETLRHNLSSKPQVKSDLPNKPKIVEPCPSKSYVQEVVSLPSNFVKINTEVDKFQVVKPSKTNRSQRRKKIECNHHFSGTQRLNFKKQYQPKLEAKRLQAGKPMEKDERQFESSLRHTSGFRFVDVQKSEAQLQTSQLRGIKTGMETKEQIFRESHPKPVLSYELQTFPVHVSQARSVKRAKQEIEKMCKKHVNKSSQAHQDFRAEDLKTLISSNISEEDLLKLDMIAYSCICAFVEEERKRFDS